MWNDPGFADGAREAQRNAGAAVPDCAAPYPDYYLPWGYSRCAAAANFFGWDCHILRQCPLSCSQISDFLLIRCLQLDLCCDAAMR